METEVHCWNENRSVRTGMTGRLITTDGSGLRFEVLRGGIAIVQM